MSMWDSDSTQRLSFRWQQPFGSKSLEFFMRDHPLAGESPTVLTLLGTDAAL